MKVVILCGGLGMRLREETEYRPKPMVEIGGRPILWHIMKTYAHFGVRDFVLCLGYRGQMIKDYFLNYEAMNSDFTIRLGNGQHVTLHGAHDEQDFAVTLASTGPDAMTGARVKRIERYITDDTFMLSYGDGLANLDIDALLRFHMSHGRIGTVTTVQPSSRFGMVELGDEGRIVSFREKPRTDGWASAGFFVFNRRIFDYVSDVSSCVLEQEPLERLVRDGELMAYRHDGFFYAMDTYREYLHLNALWDSQRAPWAVWTSRGE